MTQEVEGGRLIDYSTSIRPTRNRLLISMGISACSIALVLASLGSLFDFVEKVPKSGSENGDRLIVHIRKGEGQKHPNLTAGNDAGLSLTQEQVVSAEIAELQQRVAPVDSPDPPADSQPVKDWRAIAGEAAQATIDEYSRQEKSRALMWRRTHSVMFQPTNDILVKDEEPLLSDIRFKRYSRVLGLGFNVGSCFIGIPLAGVPVEKRSAAITVFVCS